MTLRNYDLDKTLTVRQVLEIIESLVPPFEPVASGEVECEHCGNDTFVELPIGNFCADRTDFERAIVEAL